MGTSVAQAWSSPKRCLRQYWRLQVGHDTPTEFRVFMYVLQVVCEHCVPVRNVGFPPLLGELVEGEERLAAFRRAAAHSPACVHLWDDSVRWSRQ